MEVVAQKHVGHTGLFAGGFKAGCGSISAIAVSQPP